MQKGLFYGCGIFSGKVAARAGARLRWRCVSPVSILWYAIIQSAFRDWQAAHVPEKLGPGFRKRHAPAPELGSERGDDGPAQADALGLAAGRHAAHAGGRESA